MRQTSIDVYHQIEAEGLLSKRRFQVYESLFYHGPMSQMETSCKIAGRLDHSITPRFAELKRLGVIGEVGKKICSVTGRQVLSWDVTNKLPAKVEPKNKIKCSHCDGKGFVDGI